MTSIVGTTESPHANMLDLLHFTPRSRLQKARNPSSKPLSQFEDDRSTHTNDAPDTRGVLLYENDFSWILHVFFSVCMVVQGLR